VCNERASPSNWQVGTFECNHNRQFLKSPFNHWCRCTECRKDCHLDDVQMSIAACDAAEAPVAQVKRDLAGAIGNLVVDLTIDLSNGLDEVKGAGGLGTVIGSVLGLGKGIIQTARNKEGKLMNSIIDDINARSDAMGKCTAQAVAGAKVDDLTDSIEAACLLFDDARFHVSDADDDANQFQLFNKLEAAWREFRKVAQSEFDDLDEEAEYFAQLVIPLQGFAQSFVSLSVDYLMYSRAFDEDHYPRAYEETIESMNILEIWARRAQVMIMESIPGRLDRLPCRNDADLEQQMARWREKFFDANIRPIRQYITKIEELNEILTGALPMYVKGPTSLSWIDAEEFCQNEYGTHLATITNDFQARKAVEIAGGRTWIGLSVVRGSWEWSDGTTECDYVPGMNMDCEKDPRWMSGEPNDYGGIEKCAELKSNGKYNDIQCTWTAPVLCNSPM